MSDADAMLAAILAQPAEDTPRLAFADMLQETGQEERAEFIRLQCKLEAMKLSDDRVVTVVAHTREYELIGAYGFQWTGEPLNLTEPITSQGQPTTYLGRPMITRLFDCRFRRGFVEEVRCTAESWEKHAAEAIRTNPIRKVTLTTMPPPEWLAQPDRWPGIQFVLPPAPEQIRMPEELLREAEQSILNRFAVPPEILAGGSAGANYAAIYRDLEAFQRSLFGESPVVAGARQVAVSEAIEESSRQNMAHAEPDLAQFRATQRALRREQEQGPAPVPQPMAESPCDHCGKVDILERFSGTRGWSDGQMLCDECYSTAAMEE